MVCMTSKNKKKPQQRVEVVLECGRHHAVLLPNSLRRRPQSGRRCLACRGLCSGLLREVLACLQLVEGLGPLAFECHLVRGMHKRFDIYLTKWGVAVMVDGRQHFEGSYQGVPWEVQYARDRQVDAACRLQGQRLVRLHYKDNTEWASTVKRALGSTDMVAYTSSYKL